MCINAIEDIKDMHEGAIISKGQSESVKLLSNYNSYEDLDRRIYRRLDKMEDDSKIGGR